MQLSATDTLAIAAEDGKNAVRLDLDNENDAMLYDGSGTPVSGNVTSKAYMFDGPDDVSNQTQFSIIGREGVTNAQATIDTTTHVVTVTGMNATTARVTVQGVYTDSRGDTYTKKAVLTLKKIVDGDKYDLVITPNAIAYNATTDSPDASMLAIQVWKTSVNNSGGATRALSAPPSGYGVYANGTELTASSAGTYSHTTDNSAISEVLVKIAKKTSQSDILDAETIPVNKAKNGDVGPGGAVATVTPGELSVQCDKDGKVATAISGQPLSFVLTVGGVECTNVKATRPTSGVTPPLPALPNGVSVSSSGGTIVSISVARQYAPAAGQTAPVTDTMLAAGATFLVKGTDAAGNEVTSRCTLGLKGQRQGGEGDDAVTYDLVFDTYQAIYNAQYKSFSASFSARVLKTEGAATSYVTDYTPEYRLKDSDDWLAMTYSSTSGNYSGSISAPSGMNTAPGAVNFRVRSGSTVLCTAAMPITIKGDKGETGRMFYMMGDWSASTKYERSEEVVPMVFYNDGEWNDYLEVKGGYYYLIQSSAEGENQKPGNTAYWKRCDDYGVILTQGIFADFAKLGSAIFSGDWMFSQHGKIGDTIISSSNPDYSGKKGYLYFDAGAPTGNRTLGVSGSVTNTQVTRIGGFFELSSGCKIIKVNARVNGSGQTMIVAVRKVTKASNLGYVNVTSTTNSDYYIIIKDIDNASDYYVAANMTGSGGGSISGAELVAFVPNYAVDLLTGKAYMNDAVVRGAVYADRGEFKGSVTVSNSDTQSVTITPSGITARWDNDGFRLTADGLERYDSRSGTWGPMFAGRRVDMVDYYSPSTAKSLTSTHDFVIADPSAAPGPPDGLNIYLPTRPDNGKIITIQCVSQDRSVIVNAVGGSKIITAGDSGSYSEVRVNNYERAEFVAYDNNWYVTRSAWDYGD